MSLFLRKILVLKSRKWYVTHGSNNTVKRRDLSSTFFTKWHYLNFKAVGIFFQNSLMKQAVKILSVKSFIMKKSILGHQQSIIKPICFYGKYNKGNISVPLWVQPLCHWHHVGLEMWNTLNTTCNILNINFITFFIILSWVCESLLQLLNAASAIMPREMI